jgi:cytochrome c peroxidase
MITGRATMCSLVLAGLAAAAGYWAGATTNQSGAQEAKNGQPGKAYTTQSPVAEAGDGKANQLKPYPQLKAGDIAPFELWRYAGKNGSSWSAPVLDMPFKDWAKMCKDQKPKLMAACDAYMKSRYNFDGKAIDGVRMSGGKRVMKGPVARLPKGFDSWEKLAELSPEEIKRRDIFPYPPLAHPLHTTAHMVFPQNWTKVHPEHERMDCDLDIPEAYLPEFPPPMFLTTHKEMGDVSGGREITLANYYEIFNGLLTPEQMEGLKELLRPSATTWFNHTEHRVTEQPSMGVACFSCHVNGHTNGAIALAPDSRPNLARLRVDTPTMRGNYNMAKFASKRSIRSMDHFSEVEEYFDGDPSMMRAIGARGQVREITNRMGDFNAILDFPPAPKVGTLGKLIKSKATEKELNGEKLFYGKAQCIQCHGGPSYVDGDMHDLQVERFMVCRPEGPLKNFALRGIKDSPPYLHDGRCPTLHDTVEFFNLILELKLSRDEKEDLVAYLLCL